MSTSAPADVAGPSGSASTIVARVKAAGHHVLKIDGYSLTKAMVATGDHIKSCDFHVGGHTWRIKYYPNGDKEEYADSISIMLELDGAGKLGRAVVKAQFWCSLLDQAGEPVPSHSFDGHIRSFPSPEGCTSWGFSRLIKREDLEKSEHLKNNCFAIRCDVNVMKDLDLVVEETFLNVPKSDLHTHLGHLLSTKEGTDVVFKVGEETFDAHRCVLAARSPVFKAELFGFMKPAGRCVEIDIMDARAFKALLHFIYTDTLPEMAVQDVPAVARQLLAAADKYQVERLKLVCEDRLSRHVDMSAASTGSVGADQQQHHHRRPWFMGTCLEFLSCLFAD